MTEDLVWRMLNVFRLHGYEGTSLGMLSEATGLKRASLYHRYPGGKKEMAKKVLENLDMKVLQHTVEPLLANGTPEERLTGFVCGLKVLLDDGRSNCAFNTLSIGKGGGFFRDTIGRSVDRWIAGLTSVAIDSGYDTESASRLAEETVMTIEGALVLSRIRNTTEPFLRVVDELPTSIPAKRRSPTSFQH